MSQIDKEWTESEMKLKSFMEKDFELDDESTYDVKLDLSFLIDQSVDETKPTRKTSLRFLKIASILVITLLVTTMLAAWLNEQHVEAFIDTIQNYWKQRNNTTTISDNYGLIEDTTIETREFEILSYGDIEKVSAYIEDLLLPFYIPEGYTFDKLNVELTGEDFVYTYRYTNNDMIMDINCFNVAENYKITYHDAYTIDVEDRRISINHDLLEGKISANTLYSGQLIRVISAIEDEDVIINIISNIKKWE